MKIAATSLTDALEVVGRAYARRTGQNVRFSFSSSAIVARQLERAAQAELFVSADARWMDHVQQRNLIDPGAGGAP